MTKTVVNLAASVHARLLKQAHERGEEFQFTLVRYAAERFLYRLGESRHRDKFVLKGAMLLAVWGGALYRSTKDLDFTGYGSSDAGAALESFRELCDLDVPDDGLTFDGSTMTAEPIRDAAEYDGLRIRFRAALGSANIPMQVDVGFGDAIQPPAADVDYPTLLDSPPPRIRAYPQEAVVAEKLHAMVTLGERNTRFKDFYDVYTLAIALAFDGKRLAQAATATFERRRTSTDGAFPVALTSRFYADAERARLWQAYLSRADLPGAPTHFGEVGELLLVFLIPVWHGLAQGEAFAMRWPPGGPWEHAP